MFPRKTPYIAVGFVAALSLIAPTAAQASAPPFEPGSSGLGDPYFPKAGNGGYDVKHYDLDLDFTPATHHLTATARIRATATQDLSRFDLDYSGPKIGRVLVNGRSAAYKRTGQELVVTPSHGLPKGRTLTVLVDYAGQPKPIKNKALGTYGWINTKDGAVALTEPEAARSWYPVNDHPSDKATYTFRITTPNGVTALANGERNPVNAIRNGRTTVTWQMRKPMASYLAMVAIGRFKVDDSASGGLPNVTAYDPKDAKSGRGLHKTTEKAVAWETKRFGPYPFDSLGGIIDDLGVSYALETQGRPVYDTSADEATIVHENSHQWFGDSVSVKSWNDIWLNEGFATYAEWLWSEQHGGPSAAKVYAGYYKKKASSSFWKLKTGDPGRDDMFDYNAVYLRGAMTLHALRQKIGDETFFKLLPAWTAKYKYGNAGTKDFIALAEDLSGQDLGALFDAWLYKAAKP
jgi:aminopeptidase N